ncbi:MAG TPA: hypothetical protein VFU88_11295 [Ktedonobacterales bacterium]|nr:hypothetical protein [Ktedonobacterales bacterium]
MTAFSGLSRLSPAVFALFLLNMVLFAGNLVLFAVYVVRVIALRQPESTVLTPASPRNVSVFTAVSVVLMGSYFSLWGVGMFTDRPLLSQLGYLCLNLWGIYALVTFRRLVRHS